MPDSPDVAERYATAINTSNLRVEADRGSSADVLIAAAWSPQRFGAELLRLHSEWDGCAKPKKVAQEAITVFARTMQGKTEMEKRQKAQNIADSWHAHELSLLFSRLKTMPRVREQAILKLLDWNVPDAAHIGPSVLLYWLNPICRSCNGLKFLKTKDAPSLSAKVCKPCGGSGFARLNGESAQRFETYLNTCLARARTSIRSNLQRTRKAE